MRRLYWLAAALLAAVATHAAYILIVPELMLQKTLARAAGGVGDNRLFVISTQDQRTLFPTFPASSVFAACLFDVSRGKVAINADLPDGLWTLTIYSSSGDAIYSVNDRQSGTNQFTVSLSLAPGIVEMLSLSGNEEAAANAGWEVSTSDPRGTAVFWIPSGEPAMRDKIVRALAKSNCQPVPSA